MTISIRRDDEYRTYEVHGTLTLLEALETIKQTQDPTLSFAHGCRSSICGSCAVRVNGRETLACSHKVADGDVIEPLQNLPLGRDLVVDIESSLETNKRANAYLLAYEHRTLTHQDERQNALQSDCILCNSCYSVCPVFAVNGDFLGPFALTRVWKYVSDKREGAPKEHVDAIQQNGIWDCTLCNECAVVCPQGISPKNDIEKLRIKSAQYGYSDPNFHRFGSFDSGPFF